MATNVIMPKFGLSMEEGTISVWLVREGDAVKKGDALAEINSEKLTNNALAPEDGVLAKILVPEGDTVACGVAIAIVAELGEAINAAAPAASAAKAEAPAAAAAPAAPAASAPTEAASVNITPRAKKIADEKGLEYAHIKGTGIEGAITVDDLKRFGRPRSAAVAAPAAAPAAPAAPSAPSAPAVPVSPAPAPAYAGAQGKDAVVKMTPMQQAISKAMHQSLLNAAQITIMTEANVKNLVSVYGSLKPKYTSSGLKLSYTAMLVKAVAMALENHPRMRAQLADDQHIVTKSAIDIGVAVDIPNGLVVPMIRGANLKDLRTICIELLDITTRAKAGRLTEADMGGGAITITNLGSFGITYFTPILNAPESAILGVGAIVEKPVARDGGIYIEPTMNLSLTHDHRVIDGAPAARFLQDVVASLSDFRYA
ncbi:MAG: dihydrolipoamide acetyltransferase family protein [Bacillota bacterium]